MKLELKHLAPYLPYGLEVMYNGEVCYLSGLYDNWAEGGLTAQILTNYHKTENGKSGILRETKKVNYSGATFIKPLLRPLSDLTKEIEYKGKRFVPLEKLNCKWDFKTDNEYFFESAYEGERTYLLDLIPITEKLFEWHIDVFGLIDEGLAIKK